MAKQIKKPIIFIPIECTPRELDYKLNIARIFCDADFDVMLGNPPFIRDELQYKNYQGAFLEKGVNPDPIFYKSLKEKNILLYCLSDEGASYPAFSVTYEPAVAALKTMEHIFLWGEFQKNDLTVRNKDAVLNQKYVVIGNPGFEFSLTKYKQYHKALQPKNLPQEYILVNTNFGSINGFSLEETLQACSMISPETKKMIEETYEKEKHSFSYFYKWLNAIIAHYPREQFLIRPHPTEKKSIYEAIFSKYDNVVVSKEGNINQIISSAKLVLHNDCTTALQSYLMEVPVISLAQSNMEYIRASWALSFGTVPSSKHEAIEQIEFILQHKKFDSVVNKTIEQKAQASMSTMFNNLGNSTKDLSNIMMKEMLSTFKNFAPYYVKDNRTLWQKIKIYLRRYLPLHYKVPLAARETLVYFSKKDLQDRLHLLNAIEGQEKYYSIKKIFPNAFFISKLE